MEIKKNNVDNNAVLELKGDLDYNSYKEFNTMVAELIEGLETEKIVLDMKELTHVDSMGLGTITKLWKSAEQNEVSLILAAVPKNIHNMINLVNLDKRMQICDTVDDALT